MRGSNCGRYGWHGLGLKILLHIARGLAYLHNRRVRALPHNLACKQSPQRGKKALCPSLSMQSRLAAPLLCPASSLQGMVG